MGRMLYLSPSGVLKEETVADGGTVKTANAHTEVNTEQLWMLSSKKQTAGVVGKILLPALQFPFIA